MPDSVAELEQFALDPLVSPGGVLGGEPLDERGDFGADWRPSCPVRIGPLPGHHAAAPHRRTVPGVTRRCIRCFPGRSRIRAARTARSAQSSRGLGWARRSTATSCRSTGSSASVDAGERPSKTSQPPGRTKIRYSRRKDTADHHVLRLIRAHRRSSEARQAFGTPQVHPYWTGVRVRGGRDQGRVDIATGAPVLVDPGSTLCGCRTAYSPLRGPSCRRYSRSPARPCAASPRTPGAGSPLMPSIPGTRRSWR